jgi:endoribonuclease Dicer
MDEAVSTPSARGEDAAAKPPEIVLAVRSKEPNEETYEDSQITINTEDSEHLELEAGADDVDQSDETSSAQKAPVAKKRKQNLAFEDWLQKNQREITTVSQEDLNRHIDKISVARLVKVGIDQKIIASPREYQVDLYERAKQENTIVVLDTGMNSHPSQVDLWRLT